MKSIYDIWKELKFPNEFKVLFEDKILHLSYNDDDNNMFEIINLSITEKEKLIYCSCKECSLNTNAVMYDPLKTNKPSWF